MGRADAELFAVQRHLVPANLIRAVDRTDDLRAPRADQTDQSQDLALVQRKADVVELVRIQIFDFQQRLTDETRSEGILVIDRAADHLCDHFRARQLCDGLGVDHMTVTHDGHDVAVIKDLVQLVADIDNGDAAAAQILDDAAELFQLLCGQGAGRLVHNDQLGVKGQCLGDLDHLHLRCTQVAHDGVGIDGAADGIKQRACPLVRTLHAFCFAETSQKDVFADSHFVDQIKFLIDDAQAAAQRLDRRCLFNRLTVKNDGAPILFIHAGEYLHERGLARSVFANDTVHDALRDLQRNMIQSNNAGEVFADILDDQNVIALFQFCGSSLDFTENQLCPGQSRGKEIVYICNLKDDRSITTRDRGSCRWSRH